MARSIATATSGSSRNRGVLLLAALFAVLSAALMFAFLNSRGGGESAADKALNAGQGAQDVLVVTRDVPAGERITSDMVTTRSVPVAALLNGHLTDQKDVLGKVTTAPLYAGEQVTAPKVTTYAGQTTLAFKVPDGMRALGLQVPHEAWIVGGLVQPGDRVDVIGITTLSKIDPLTGQERPDVVGGIIAENVEVLAVSQTLVKVIPNLDMKAKVAEGATAEATAGADASATPGSGPLATGSGASKDSDATFEKAISITLALPPDLAAKVAIIDALKDDVGQYRIVPRQRGDGVPITGALTWSLEDVFGAKKK
ncbi:MAG: Flp pilus assembly protein CpaB [Dehalococcoidia bacterium]|nr:Flp pilus assembly protein CpaB [Dehalococcoidia bacterium]